MWIKLTQDDTRRIQPKQRGIVTSTIKYKAGMVENVPREYGLRLVAEGKAVETVSPREDKPDATTQDAKPGNGPAGKS